MTMMIRKFAIGACIAGLLTFVPGAFAEDGVHDKAIEARQAMFKLYGFNFGILGAMAKEKMPYDAAIAAEAANNLSAAANMGQSQLWPQGSDEATKGNAPNRALPVIWASLPDVTEKADALKTSVAALVPVAGNGLDALQGAMGDVGGSCKGCHDDYRAKKK